MPNITEFDAGNLSIRPSETGVEAFAAAGRRIGAFYNQTAGELTNAGARIGHGITEAGDIAVKYEDQKQISAGAASGAQLFADQLEKKDAAIKAIDPNDPHYGQKVEVAVKQWREEQLEPALQDFAGQFTTTAAKDWATRYVDNTRQTMFVHSTADIASAAGIGIHNAARTTVNTATTTVFRDPSMLDNQIDLVEHGITGLVQSNPVKGVDAARIQSDTMERAKEQMVKAAIQGTIMKGGNWQGIANKYPDYVNAAEMKQFEKAEQVQARASVANEKAIQLYSRQLAVEDGKQQVSKIVSDGVSVDDAGNATIKPGYFPKLLELVAKNPEAAETAKTWFNWGEELNKRAGSGEKIRTDPGVMSTLGARVLDADHPLTEQDTIKAETDAMQGKPGIAHKEGDQLRDLINKVKGVKNDYGFKIAMDGAKEIIEGGMGAAGKPEQAGKFGAFMQKFLDAYAKEDRPANALDLNDEKSLIRQMIAPYAAVNSMGPLIKANGGVGAPPAAAAPAPSPPKPKPIPAGLLPPNET